MCPDPTMACRRGHPWTDETTGWKKGGNQARLYRYCKPCLTVTKRRLRAKLHNRPTVCEGCWMWPCRTTRFRGRDVCDRCLLDSGTDQG